MHKRETLASPSSVSLTCTRHHPHRSNISTPAYVWFGTIPVAAALILALAHAAPPGAGDSAARGGGQGAGKGGVRASGLLGSLLSWKPLVATSELSYASFALTKPVVCYYCWARTGDAGRSTNGALSETDIGGWEVVVVWAICWSLAAGLHRGVQRPGRAAMARWLGIGSRT